MLAPYARVETSVVLLVGAAGSAACAYWLGWWGLAPAVATLAVLSFYRDPPRRIPPGDDLLLAPADGRVVEVGRVGAGPDGAGELRVVIFLSVLNVHVNRSPCAGVVREVRYTRGEFLSALRPESTERNEQNAVVIDPQPPIPGRVVVRQIAGGLARRIVCVARPGDRLQSGQRFGMIKLGSRTELRLSEDPRWRVLVRVGDRVKGGRTVVARLDGTQDRA